MTAYREFTATPFCTSTIRSTIARNTIRIHNWEVGLTLQCLKKYNYRKLYFHLFSLLLKTFSLDFRYM